MNSRVCRWFVLAGLTVSVVACDRSYIEGRVTNRRGEALPGVTVAVEDGSTQDLSDGLGHYRIEAAPGPVKLVFTKSGYTSARLALEGKRRGATPEVVMWVLPMNAGVYDVTPLTYHETSWALPKQYYLKDGTAAFGIELSPGLIESTSEPFLLTHRTPRYNAQLSRLMPEEARLAGIEDKSIEVWVEAGTAAVGLEALDQSESLLQRVVIGRALEPGVYGIHWGAMEGYTTLDNRVFLFRVPEPPKSEEDEAVAEGEEAGAVPAEAATGEEAAKKDEASAKKDAAPAKNEETPAKEPAPAEPKAAPKAEPPAQDLLEPAQEETDPLP